MENNNGYYLMPHPPIIIPEIGKGEEHKIQKTTEACLKIGKEIRELAPETIIIITPHGPLFSDMIAITNEISITGSFSQFKAPNVTMKIDIDLDLTQEIIRLAKERAIDTIGVNDFNLKNYDRKLELDHGSMVPLYFVNKFYPKYQLVHITYGMLTEVELYQFGLVIKDAIKNVARKTVLIASGDLSHRLSNDGPYPFSSKGKWFDQQILSSLEKGAVIDIFNMKKSDIEEAGECGYRSILILLGVIGEFKGERLSYEGPFGVGYGVMSFHILDQNQNYINVLLQKQKKALENRQKGSDRYVKLARESLNYYFQHNKMMDVPENIPEEMKINQAGVFVSLKKAGNLRGCIGTFSPTSDCIASEIIQNSISAAFEDPRFNPVEKKELDKISISVDVLQKPISATVSELEPKIYGVIVSQGRKKGLLLPNLEGVDTVSEQLNIACQKAGIHPNSSYDIEKFTVIRHIEGEM